MRAAVAVPVERGAASECAPEPLRSETQSAAPVFPVVVVRQVVNRMLGRERIREKVSAHPPALAMAVREFHRGMRYGDHLDAMIEESGLHFVEQRGPIGYRTTLVERQGMCGELGALIAGCAEAVPAGLCRGLQLPVWKANEAQMVDAAGVGVA